MTALASVNIAVVHDGLSSKLSHIRVLEGQDGMGGQRSSELRQHLQLHLGVSGSV